MDGVWFTSEAICESKGTDYQTQRGELIETSKIQNILHEISKGGLETTTQASQMIWPYRHSCRAV